MGLHSELRSGANDDLFLASLEKINHSLCRIAYCMEKGLEIEQKEFEDYQQLKAEYEKEMQKQKAYNDIQAVRAINEAAKGQGIQQGNGEVQPSV